MMIAFDTGMCGFAARRLVFTGRNGYRVFVIVGGDARRG
jgi:hypothetical protein